METIGGAGAEGDAGDATDRLADVVHTIEAERVEERDDVVGQQLDGPRLVAGGRSAVGTHVAADDAPIAARSGTQPRQYSPLRPKPAWIKTVVGDCHGGAKQSSAYQQSKSPVCT